MKLIAAIMIALSVALTTPVIAQREDTTSTVVVDDMKQLVIDQLFMSFKMRSVGLLQIFCEDSVDFSIRMSETNTECMTRYTAMNNLRGFFEGMPYEGFSYNTRETEFGTVAYFKIFMDMERPDYIVYMFFLIDPCTFKISKMLVIL